MSEDDVTSDGATALAHRRSGGDAVRLVLRGTGQTLITAGLVVLLFVVYEVWVSNVFAHIKQTRVHNTLIKQWAQGDDPLVGLPGASTSTIPTGTGIANIYVPRWGSDYHLTIVEGTDEGDLDEGPGHYVGTALPGEVGNFAVAGHRVGKGEPFLNIDQLKPGDPIVIETAKSWFVYKVLGDPATGDLSTAGPEGVVGREIVDPSDGRVILPVPNQPGASPTVALMTMTSCTPKFSATQRMIVHSQLTTTLPSTGTAPPPALLAAIGGTL